MNPLIYVKELDSKILGELDVDSLKYLCSINEYTKLICNDKCFWINKFDYDELPLINNFNTDNEWIDEYKKISVCKNKAKKVLLINEIEKDRKDNWASEGVIEIIISDINNYFSNECEQLIKDAINELDEYTTDYYIIHNDKNNYTLQCIIDAYVDGEEKQYDIQENKKYADVVNLLTIMIYHNVDLKDISLGDTSFLIESQEPPINYNDNQKLWFNRRVGLWEALNCIT